MNMSNHIHKGGSLEFPGTHKKTRNFLKLCSVQRCTDIGNNEIDN